MTLDEFLDDYVPRVLKPMGDWQLKDGLVRRMDCCPLTAELGLPAFDPTLGDTLEKCRQHFGLTSEAVSDIVAGADRPTYTNYSDTLQRPKIRARLLAGLGLSEPGGERGRA